MSLNKFAGILFHFIILNVALPAVSYSQTNNTLIEKQIDSIVMASMEENKIAGLSIGIVKDNAIYFIKGYGTRELNKKLPVDSLTNFLTASISKLFTATAIFQLVEQRKIDINKKLTDYLPDFEMKDDRYKKITIEQILTHTSGLPNIYNRNFIHPENDSVALTEFAQALKRKKLSYEPGVQLSSKTYSNTGYDILGLVIERITGKIFSDYINENILGPVGMTHSSFFYQKIDVDRRSVPHKKSWLTKKIKPSKYYPDIPQDKPCGNLNSCSLDLCKWMLHNLAIYHSTKQSKGVLEHNTLVKMWTTTHTIPPYKTSLGLGWWINQSDKYGKFVFHVGNDPGFSATLNIFPENDFGIVILCNGEYPKDAVWNKIPFDIISVFKDSWKK